MESPDAPELVPEASEVNQTIKTGSVVDDTNNNSSSNTNQAKELQEQPLPQNQAQETNNGSESEATGQHNLSEEPKFGDPDAIWPEYCNPAYVMPDKIDVKVTVGPDTYFFPVSIEKVKGADARKVYLGGYRNKLTGVIYHHAATQTPSDRKTVKKDYSNLRTRETQTFETRTLSVQLGRECGTQMERVDLRLDNKRDTYKYSKPYMTSDQLLAIKKECVILIQRNFRGCLARTLANQIRQRNIDFAKEMAEKKEIDEEELRQQRMVAMARRTHPKTNDDFAALYNELDVWRKGEVAKIKATITDPEERKLAMAELLQNETKALQGIQKLKVNARKELQVEKTQEMLSNMAKPHQWQLSKGETAQVHTPETQRAQELFDLYNALTAEPLLSTEQRLDVLLNVKWTVRELEQEAFQQQRRYEQEGDEEQGTKIDRSSVIIGSHRAWAQLTNEIMELVDREADLLNRGRSVQTMASLRTRIANLFLRFIENPIFNPRAAEFLVEK